MMYNDEFLSIQIPKTGGTSLRQAFRYYEGMEFGRKRRHDTILQLSDLNDGKRWTFSFIRNPWNWLVSLYDVAILTREEGRFKKYYKINHQEDMTFSDFVLQINHTQFDWLVNENGEIAVDDIFKLEDIDLINETRFKKFFGKTFDIKRYNVIKHNPIPSFYNKELNSFVEERFSREIEFGDYSLN